MRFNIEFGCGIIIFEEENGKIAVGMSYLHLRYKDIREMKIEKGLGRSKK